MPCTNELNRAQDKYTAYQNAQAVATGAVAAQAAASAAVFAACPLFWTGLGGVACAGAVTALATAVAATTAAIMQRDNALQAYRWAKTAYDTCLAKCKKP